jgi:hypothetical protein
MMLFTKRIERDNRRIAETEDIVTAFLKEIAVEVEELRTRYIERRDPLMAKLKQMAGAA